MTDSSLSVHNEPPSAYLSERGVFGPATVLATHPDGEYVQVQSDQLDFASWARIAVFPSCVLEPDDLVLISGTGPEDIYVVGVLRSRDTERNVVRLRNGTSARSVRTGESEKLQVRSQLNELLFEYDTETGKTRVNVASGDLEFAVPHGNIDFKSAGDIRMQAQSMVVASRRGIRFGVRDAVGKVLSAITLHPRALRLEGSKLDVESDSAELKVEKAKLSGNACSVRFRSIRTVTDKLECVAECVIQKASNMYRTVKELSQTKAGRIRTLVDSIYQFNSKQAFMKTEEDFNVRGDSINLG